MVTGEVSGLIKGRKWRQGGVTFWDWQKITGYNFWKCRLVDQCWVPDLPHECVSHFAVGSLMAGLFWKEVWREFRLYLGTAGVTAAQTVSAALAQ